MVSKYKQERLSGIEATMRAILFGDLLQELVSKHGLTTLANEIGVDKATLSRFKNGEGTMALQDIDKLLQFSNIIMVTRDRYQRNMVCAITMAENLRDALSLE